MKEILEITIGFTRLILGSILCIVLFIIVVSLFKIKELCGKK